MSGTLKAGNEVETMEDCYLAAGSPCSHSCIVRNLPRTTWSAVVGGIPLSELGSPT